RAAQALVRGRGHNMRVREGGGVRAARDEAGKMRHIDEQPSAYFVGDRAERGEIPMARIGRAAGDNQLRLVLARDAANLVHIEPLVLTPHTVRRSEERRVGKECSGGWSA